MDTTIMPLQGPFGGNKTSCSVDATRKKKQSTQATELTWSFHREAHEDELHNKLPRQQSIQMYYVVLLEVEEAVVESVEALHRLH
jgi:hypothetical protein